MTPDELRAAVRGAQISGKGQYIEDGRHLLEIDRALVVRSTIDGNVKETWIVEFKVLASTNPSHEVGSTRTYAENPANAGWLGRFKGCIAAVIGAGDKLSEQDEKTIDDVIVCLRYDEERKRLGWPENFLKSRQVNCEGFKGKSRSGGEITNKRWSAVVA